MSQATAQNFVLEFTDVSGQKSARVSNAPKSASIGELVRGMVEKLTLTPKDSEGRELTYQARLEREGRHLHASELVGDALRSGDRVELHPNVDAG